MKSEILVCKIHGEYNHYYRKDRKKYECSKCRSDRVAEYRRTAKRTLVEEFGARCCIRGYNKSIRALHFHHVDPSIKSYNLSENGICRSLPKMREEAKKCILVCSNCHMEIEEGITQIPE